MSVGFATRSILQRYPTLFWDFDGVIKESVVVKSEAFQRLFAPFGPTVAARVREHHECHGGMSRSEKLPLYLKWAGCDGSAEEVERYSERFSLAVCQAVIECPWVAGAREYLQSSSQRQCCVLVTATPQLEMENILQALDAIRWFSDVYGTPTSKAEAIASVLARRSCRRSEALMIGDSEADHAAAEAAGVDFLLRRTDLNRALQRSYTGPQCEDFL
jgi:HAD superfamily hydrolase (TIGR01549 family)